MRAALPLLACLLLLAACGEEVTYDTRPPKLTWQIALLTPDPQPEAAVGVAYDVDLFYNIAGEGPYSWAVSAGSLPPGLTLEPSTTQYSRLYGTPTTYGNYVYTITINCDVGPVDFIRNTQVLQAGSLLITSYETSFGTAGSAYGQNVYATGGSGVGYSWTVFAGTLPMGLDIDARDITLNWGSFSQTGNLDQSLGGGKLSQASGMCASLSQPGVLWVHDEAGGFFAVDSSGNVLQEYAFTGTPTAVEDVAIGPGGMLYFADAGDPGLSRADCRIYRVAEPQVPASPGPAITVAEDTYWFVYPGGAQDCGTLLVDRENNTLFVVECVDNGTPRVHRFPTPLSTSWTAANPVSLTQMTAGGYFPPGITGGDTSADGRRMVLRTYTEIREYALPFGQGFNMVFGETGTPLSAPGTQQHEAVCYSGDGTTIFTTTELSGMSAAPIHGANASPDNGYTTIAGLPTTAGTKTFIVRVTDSAGNVAYRQLTIHIS